MNVSIINLNLVGPDAMGQSILAQVRYFQRRGDTVRLFVHHEPHQIPDAVRPLVQVTELAALLARRDAHFAQSDLYIYHYPSHYPLVESIRSIDRGRVLFFYHNVTPPELWVGSEDDRVHLAHSRSRLPSLLPYADLVVTPSAYNAEELVADFGAQPESVRLLPLAVPLDAFAPRDPDPALRARYGVPMGPVLLFVGRMAGNKRIDLLVEALHALRASHPEALLLLAGDDRSNDGIRRVVQETGARALALGVADRVHFIGPVDDVAPLFNLAELYVTASLHEGFGVPLIEAMASGVPVVASNVAAHPWVVGEAGLLVPPEEPAAMADAIARLLGDDGLYGEMVRRGRERAASHSVEYFNQRWGAIVAEVVGGMPPTLPAPDARLATPSPAAPLAQRRRDPLPLLIEQLRHSSDTMHRGYQVRSGAPIVGFLIAWLRRNLTSHLREPYIDPTFERQTLFNQQVTHVLRLLSERPQLSRTAESHLAEIERLSHTVRAQVAAGEEVGGTLDELDAEVAALRAALKKTILDEE